MRVKITESKLKNLVSRVVNEELRRFNNDDRRIKSALRESIKSVLNESKEGDYRKAFDDIFKFLAQDAPKGSISTVYYTAPARLFNKSYMDKTGKKKHNPCYGNVYKHQYIKFNYGATYERAYEKIKNQMEAEGKTVRTPEEVKAVYETVQGYDLLEIRNNKLYLPVIPIGGKSSYTFVDANGNHRPIEYDEFDEYVADRLKNKPEKEVVDGGEEDVNVDFRRLLVDRIYQIKAGGKDWINPHFEFTYLGPE